VPLAEPGPRRRVVSLIPRGLDHPTGCRVPRREGRQSAHVEIGKGTAPLSAARPLPVADPAENLTSAAGRRLLQIRKLSTRAGLYAERRRRQFAPSSRQRRQEYDVRHIPRPERVLRLTVTVAPPRTYTLQLPRSPAGAPANASLNVDGVNVTGKLAIPNSAGTPKDHRLKIGVHLTRRHKHVLRMISPPIRPRAAPTSTGSMRSRREARTTGTFAHNVM